MASITIPGLYTYSGSINNGAQVVGPIVYSSDSLSCADIMTAMDDVQAPDSYPVECDFVTLSNTGVVFFMDPGTLLITQSLEIEKTQNGQNGFSEEEILLIYKMEVGFIILVIAIWTLVRAFVKISRNRI